MLPWIYDLCFHGSVACVMHMIVKIINILYSEAPPAMAERTLSLMTKVVQKLANLVEFKSKEPYMTALNPFIIGNMDRMKAFVSELSVSNLHSLLQLVSSFFI